MISSQLIFLFIHLLFHLIFIGSFHVDDCHRLFPSAGGKWRDDPPFWIPNCRQNQTNIFDREATTACLQNRTVYAIGNSVGRQALFGVLEMLGGATVKRENQRDLCEKHETFWGDSCHDEYAGVKLKYLFLQFMDGYNYSERGGFPYLMNPSQYDPLHLPNQPGEVVGSNAYWEEDNCIHQTMKECLRKFFQNATKEDILIFTLGMPYTTTNAGEKIDTLAWVRSSASNFRSNLVATFPGKVFRISNAQMLKHLAAYTDLLLRIDHEVLWPAWSPGSVPDEEQWYTIDQWAINKDRNHLYNDQVHYNGPLTHAMLHQVLNLLCPTKGIPRAVFDHLQENIIVVNRGRLSKPASEGQGGTAVGGRETSKVLRGLADREVGEFASNTAEERDALEKLTKEDGEDTLEYYVFDAHVKLHRVAKECLSYINKKLQIQLSEADIKGYELLTDFPTNICVADNFVEELLIRPSHTKEVFLLKDYKMHSFPNLATLTSHGYDFDQVKVVEDWIVDLIARGKEVK